MDPDELRGNAESLRTLANDIEDLLSNAKGYVNNDMQSWEGPNQEEVAGALSGWNTECTTVAEELRGLATSLDSQADQAEEDAEEEED